MRRPAACLIACVALMLVALPAAAQVSVTGSISGTVLDTSAGVVPGATVQLKDEGTGIQKETTTNPSGDSRSKGNGTILP